MSVTCDDCGRIWRIPCPECSDHHADWHRQDSGHERVNVIPDHDERRRRYATSNTVTQASWPEWMRENKVLDGPFDPPPPQRGTYPKLEDEDAS